MFEHLVAPRPATRTRTGALWSAGLSVTVHASVGVLVLALANGSSAHAPAPVSREVYLPSTEAARASHPQSRAHVVAPPVDGLSGMTIPVVRVPTGIPAIGEEQLDRGRFRRGMPAGPGVSGPWAVGRAEPGGDGPIAAQLLAEPPLWLAGPPPTYPPLLRTAGIDGQVELEFVVDTTGRPEPATLRVIEATHQAFVTEARRAILGSRYRPGRLRGRRVRVLVTQIVAFAIR